MRDGETIMPCVSFNIIVRENIYPLFFTYIYKWSIGKLGIEELGSVIPQVFVKFRSIGKIDDILRLIEYLSHFTNAEIIKAQL